MSSVDALLSSLESQSDSALRTAREVTSRISSNTLPALSNPTLQYTFTKPVLAPPPSFGDLLSSDTTGSTIQFLDAEVEKLLEKFFPDLSALANQPEQWIAGVISGDDPFGQSTAVLEGMWHQSRDMEYRARNAEVDQVMANFSARGFTLPPGALVSAVTQAETRASDAIADVNRTQTIRLTELKVQLLQFAVEQGSQLKLGIMGVLANFYQQWVQLPQRDVDLARAKAQIYATAQGALSDYYRVQVAFEQLRLQAESTRMDGGISVDRNKITAAEGSNASGALGQAVDAFAKVSSAAVTAQQALVLDQSVSTS